METIKECYMDYTYTKYESYICNETYPVFLFGHIVTCLVWETKTCKDLDHFCRTFAQHLLNKGLCQTFPVLLNRQPIGCGEFY